MSESRSPAPVPRSRDLDALRDAAAGCAACDLVATGTQTVFGEGAPDAAIMLVGEQPGDSEDREGRPFVGPAGRVLDEGLEAAGIDRGRVYITNAVKHFKWTPRGKRRIHAKPNGLEIAACRPWLDAEIAAVRPGLVVCLGATAAQALLGRDFRVTRHRGEVLSLPDGTRVTATVHPSSILRMPDEAARHTAMEEFVHDLRVAAAHLGRARRTEAAASGSVSCWHMPQEFSFDVVSDFDHQELLNAVDQARREIGTRYDFKNLTAEIELEKEQITLTTEGDMQLRAMTDVLKSKFHKRNLDLKILDAQKPENAAKGNVRQVIKLRRGINDELAKKLQKQIRGDHPKVQVRIQGDQLRVTGKDKDTLQAVIAKLREADLDVPLQFTNYR